MSKPYRVDIERAVTSLYYFNERTQALLKEVVQGVVDRIAQRERAQLATHSRTGKLANSVRTRVKVYKDRAVSGTVTVGGGKRVPYGNLFERGIDTTQAVPAHERTSSLGNKFSVKAYEMKFLRPAHEYLSAALKTEALQGKAEVQRAVSSAASEAGF